MRRGKKYKQTNVEPYLQPCGSEVGMHHYNLEKKDDYEKISDVICNLFI